MEGKSAAIYMRVSTEEQRDRQTIETQRDFAVRFCELHSIRITDFYIDNGVSGAKRLEEREEGKRLLADARKKKFLTLLVYKLDRLGRDPRLILNAVADLEDAGVQVQSMTEPFDTSTPSGRFMLTILSGVAGLERETIIERSMEGSKRLAREGTWMGGIVPYGYKVVGMDREARLVPSVDPIPGLELSEVDVIRMMYRMSAVEQKSCIAIAEHFNKLGIPPAYIRDGRTTIKGKRSRTVQGVWGPGRIRNMLVSTTYKGISHYGKRAKRMTEVIEQRVPAIVSEETWQMAQETLRKNYLFSRRNSKRHYLLRGLIKCGLCGRSFIGTVYPGKGEGGVRVYYVCYGKNGIHRTYSTLGEKCKSKAVDGLFLEQRVWEDIENFIRNPEFVIDELRSLQKTKLEDSETLHNDAQALKKVLLEKENERDAVVSLFRKKRIDEDTLDKQLDEIEREEEVLRKQVARLEEQAIQAFNVTEQLTSAENLLRELNEHMEPPISWETKRMLVEALVEEIRVDTFFLEDGRKETEANITYKFSIATHRDIPEDNNWKIQRSYYKA